MASRGGMKVVEAEPVPIEIGDRLSTNAKQTVPVFHEALVAFGRCTLLPSVNGIANS